MFQNSKNFSTYHFLQETTSFLLGVAEQNLTEGMASKAPGIFEILYFFFFFLAVRYGRN